MKNRTRVGRAIVGVAAVSASAFMLSALPSPAMAQTSTNNYEAPAPPIYGKNATNITTANLTKFSGAFGDGALKLTKFIAAPEAGSKATTSPVQLANASASDSYTYTFRPLTIENLQTAVTSGGFGLSDEDVQGYRDNLTNNSNNITVTFGPAANNQADTLGNKVRSITYDMGNGHAKGYSGQLTGDLGVEQTGTITQNTVSVKITSQGTLPDTTAFRTTPSGGGSTPVANVPGVYCYEVTQSDSSHIQKADTNWADSQARYLLRLYVALKNGNLVYDGFTLQKWNTDDGGALAGNNRIKCPLVFLDRWTGVAPLEIRYDTKNTGYANKEQKFAFTVTLNYPDYLNATVNNTAAYPTSNPSYTSSSALEVDASYKINNGGTTTISAGTLGSTTLGTSQTPILLDDDDFIVFNDLPVGTTYTVKEMTAYNDDTTLHDSSQLPYYVYAGETPTPERETSTGYIAYNKPVGTGSADTSFYGTLATDGSRNTAYTLGGGGSSQPGLTTEPTDTVRQVPVIGSSDNKAYIINDAVPPTPTGFIVEYVPYAVIAGGILVGIVALALTNKRRRSSLSYQVAMTA